MAAKKIKTAIRQSQITNAALETIGKHGFKGFTISAIAKKVGIADGNVYRHFKDKDAVMGAIVSEIGRVIKRIVKEACGEKDSPLKCLERIFFKHISFLEGHRGIPRVIFSDDMYSADRSLTLKLQASITQYMDEIKTILREGVKEKALDSNLDIDAAAVAFVGLIQATALQWALFGYSFSPKSRGKKIWQIYLKGILSRR